MQKDKLSELTLLKIDDDKVLFALRRRGIDWSVLPWGDQRDDDYILYVVITAEHRELFKALSDTTVTVSEVSAVHITQSTCIVEGCDLPTYSNKKSQRGRPPDKCLHHRRDNPLVRYWAEVRAGIRPHPRQTRESWQDDEANKCPYCQGRLRKREAYRTCGATKCRQQWRRDKGGK